MRLASGNGLHTMQLSISQSVGLVYIPTYSCLNNPCNVFDVALLRTLTFDALMGDEMRCSLCACHLGAHTYVIPAA